MHPSLRHTSHRPWPLPDGDWKWRQSWQHAAFIHYRVEAAAIRERIPGELRVQEFEGSAWVAIVPFLMSDVMRGTWPSFPPLRAFPEVNVRTYVECNGRPGIWFFSLDADCWPIVLGGRILYGVPYFRASMSHALEDGGIRFESLRLRDGACFRATYRPVGPVYRPRSGSFEHWMAERYCLYSRVRGGTICVDVHHQPWPMQAAEVQVRQSDLLEAGRLKVLEDNPRCHFSSGVEVVSYAAYRTDLLQEPALLPATGQASFQVPLQCAPIASDAHEPRT